MLPIRFPLLLSILLAGLSCLAELPLTRGPSRDVELEPRGSILELRITGKTPHFWTGTITQDLNPESHQVLSFEYFAPSGLKAFDVRFRQKGGEMVFAGSKPLPFAETWQPFHMDLSKAPSFPEKHPDLRFHFALKGNEGTVFQLRNLCLRPANAEERRAASELAGIQSERDTLSREILTHLRDGYPAQVHSIQVSERDLTITGQSKTPARIQEIPPHLHAHSPGRPATDINPNPDGNFTITLPRFEERRDRAFSRWRLVDAEGLALSQNHWADEVAPSLQQDLPKLSADHPKGLGGMVPLNDDSHEIFDLGIQHATINFVLTSILSDKPRPGWKPHPFGNQTFYLNEKSLGWRDETIRRLSRKNVIVSCILLVGNHRDAAGMPTSLMTHPDAEPRGTYSMPNLTTPRGTALYQAVIALLAERYSREDGAHGRISNWVLHNEVDQGGTWTNMGDQPLAVYLETLHRSARIVHLATRLHDPHSRVFLSMTHHWNKQSSGHGTYHARNLLTLFAEFSRTEGDFEWGLAYHPYPRNLRNPDTWEDTEVTLDFDTPYITPRNLEVLVDYMKQPQMRFKGQTRGILLSEQGFNTPTLSEEDQKRQVAGLVYTFDKLKKLPEIEAYHLHRYQDMPDREGGLRLGIITETGAHKLGWDAYKAIGTEAEAPFAALAKEVIGNAPPLSHDKKRKARNVVLIVADDLGWADTSAYVKDEPQFYRTPHIEKLASQGMKFVNAYSASPLCSPTRASILTGQYPGRIRLTTPACHLPQVVLDPQLKASASPNAHAIEPETRTRFPNHYVTLAERLKEAGVATAFVGKWHLGRAPYFPDQQGFDHVIGGREHPGPPGGFFAPWPIDTIPQAPEGSHIDDVITTESIKWMKKQAAEGKPFYLNLWYYSVHAPLEAKPELVAKYREIAKTLPKDAPRKNPVMAAMIETLDANVGRIMKALEELGLNKDTLVIFTSDNGGNEYNYVAGELATNNHPLHNGKGNIADGGQRVPFIASWPGVIPENAVSESLVSSIDIFPTLLAATGNHPAPEQVVDGIDLGPILSGESKGDPKRAIFCHFPHSPPATGTITATSVRRGPWKLTRFFADGPGQSDRLRLVHLENDPGELVDQSASQAERVRELNQLISDHLVETDTLVPVPNPRYKKSFLGWEGSSKTTIHRIDGALVVQADHKDPFIQTSAFSKLTSNCAVEITMTRTGSSKAQLYWSTDREKGSHKDRMKMIEVVPDGQPHTYQVGLSLGKDRLTQLRIDPAMEPGESRIHAIRLIQWNAPGAGITRRLWEF